MAKVNCPQCGASAVRVALIDGYKFYCSRGGWNHEFVRRELFSTIKVSLVLVALGLVLAIVARVKSPGEGWAWAGILLAFSGLPVYYDPDIPVLKEATTEFAKLQNCLRPVWSKNSNGLK